MSDRSVNKQFCQSEFHYGRHVTFESRKIALEPASCVLQLHSLSSQQLIFTRTPSMTIDINCDAGETSREIDDSILPFVSSCNVCCGAHAGDEQLITGTIKKSIELGVKVGAHPSWPDRENFGRQTMDLPLDQLKVSLREQILFVKTITESNGDRMQHVKPHGALYHDVLRRPELAKLLLEIVSSIDPALAIYGQAGSGFAKMCQLSGLQFVHEAFGDRRYESATELRARSKGDGMIETETEFCDHVGRLIKGTVLDIHGQSHQLPVETICLHSDAPNAINFARLAHEIIAK